MSPAPQLTTAWRVTMAIAFAFLLPSLILSQAYVLASNRSPDPAETLTPVSAAFLSLIFGPLFGWSFVLLAAVAWAVLEQINRHYVWAAAAVGGATGLAVAVLRAGLWPRMNSWEVGALCGSLGVATALGVWWIAYGRQDRLPKPSEIAPLAFPDLVVRVADLPAAD